MIVKLFGVMDIFAVLVLLALHFSLGLHWKLIVLAIFYLIGKGLLFRGNFHSHLDIAIGVFIILLALIGFIHWITFVPAIYLTHKGIRSWI